MLDPPRKRSGPATTGPPHIAATKQASTGIVPDRWNAQRRAAARELEQVAALARYYGPRRPRPIPLGQFLAEGWWAA
jgi:hypothetical protein